MHTSYASLHHMQREYHVLALQIKYIILSHIVPSCSY